MGRQTIAAVDTDGDVLVGGSDKSGRGYIEIASLKTGKVSKPLFTFKQEPPIFAVGGGGRLFVLRDRDIVVYDRPYVRQETVLALRFNPLTHVTQLVSDQDNDLLVLASRNDRLGHTTRQGFGVSLYRPPYREAQWETGMHDDPGSFPGTPVGVMSIFSQLPH